MAAVPYVGKTQTAAADLATRGYLNTVLAANMSQASVDSLLSSGFSPYVLKSYVDTQDALNATKSFIDAGDAARLQLSQKGANNGIAGLDASGKIAPARLNVPSTQRFPKSPWTPSSYFASPVSTVAETTLYSTTISDPGFSYKIICFGLVDGCTSLDGTAPRVLVRVGSTSGTIIATSLGQSEFYGFNVEVADDFNRANSATLGGSWTGRINNNPVGTAMGIDGNAAAGLGTGVPHGGLFTVSSYNTPMSGDDVQLDLTVGSANVQDESIYLFMGANTTGTCFTMSCNSNLSHGFAMFTTNSWNNSDGFLVSNFVGTSANYGPGDVLSSRRVGNVYTGLLNGVPIPGMSWTDSSNVLPRDSSHRLVGIGAYHNTDRNSYRRIDSMSAGTSPSGGPVNIVSQDLGVQSVLTGASTLYVRLASSGSASVTARPTSPSLYVMAVPA